MAISTQDFTKGLDFTGLGTSATAAQHNQLIEQGVPTPDASADVGRGLCIVTTDSAVGVPVVPDAATNTKWQRYMWIRRPHNSDSSQVIRQYAWNSNASYTSVATYLKWSQSTVDLSSLQTQVDTANSNATTALAAANTAQTTANSANTNATDATAAATAANNAAAAAQTTANTALSTSTTASANASAALTAANSATTAANANIGAARLVGYSAAFQKLRSNIAGTLVEWFDPRNELVIVTNATTQTPWSATVTLGASASTVTTSLVPLITIDTPGALCTIAPVTYQMTFSAGIYKFYMACRLNGSHVSLAGGLTIFLYSYYIALQKVSDNSIVLTSQEFLTNSTVAATSDTFLTQIVLSGVVTIPVSAADKRYRVIVVHTVKSTTGGTSATLGYTIAVEPLFMSFDRFAQTP